MYKALEDDGFTHTCDCCIQCYIKQTAVKLKNPILINRAWMVQQNRLNNWYKTVQRQGSCFRKYYIHKLFENYSFL